VKGNATLVKVTEEVTEATVVEVTVVVVAQKGDSIVLNVHIRFGKCEEA